MDLTEENIKELVAYNTIGGLTYLESNQVNKNGKIKL